MPAWLALAPLGSPSQGSSPLAGVHIAPQPLGLLGMRCEDAGFRAQGWPPEPLSGTRRDSILALFKWEMAYVGIEHGTARHITFQFVPTPEQLAITAPLDQQARSVTRLKIRTWQAIRSFLLMRRVAARCVSQAVLCWQRSRVWQAAASLPPRFWLADGASGSATCRSSMKVGLEAHLERRPGARPACQHRSRCGLEAGHPAGCTCSMAHFQALCGQAVHTHAQAGSSRQAFQTHTGSSAAAQVGLLDSATQSMLRGEKDTEQ